ncbi:YihY/virulence factor BrkB family protein [Lysobacter korlensis]|uniref:YihY/virulence factor BrkB family protein n=1 Tax=Lysobacter korlensis TaxID=553636 RepID=A0ABV6RZ08_9GAMM
MTRESPARPAPVNGDAHAVDTSAVGRPTRADWAYVIRRSWRGFIRHRGFDSAAALTFFSALSLFPSALVVVSAIAMVDDGNAVRNILAIVQELAQNDTVLTLESPLEQLLTVPYPGLGLVVGLVLAIWTLSAYAAAFGRAMNSAYQAEEGRPFIRMRLLMLGLAGVLAVLLAALGAIILITPRVAAATGAVLGVGEPWVTAWNIAKWPVLAALVTFTFALLYHFTPTVRHERKRWLGVGASCALVVGGLATAGFVVYVTTVSNYGRLYGWLGGALVLLAWLYIVNFSLMLGGEVDAEFVRLKQLRRGIRAEEVVRMPMRETERTLTLARNQAEDERQAREIRERATAARRAAEEHGE